MSENETEDEMARRVHREVNSALEEAFREWLRDPLPGLKVTPGPAPREINIEMTLPGNIREIQITNPDLFKDDPAQCKCPCGTCDRDPCVFEGPPKDIIRAAIQGGTVYIERAEMEWAQAMGVDIREVLPSQTRLDALRKATIDPVSIVIDPCGDCKGSGIYEGITSRGACEKCEGRGRA